MSRVVALGGLFLVALVACPAPPPSARFDTCLDDPVNEVKARWPTVGVALADQDVYGQAVWYWAHKRGSLDGFGATLATVTRRPGLGPLPEDVPAQRAASEPSLLFFDQTSEDAEDWPLIGMGYFYPFDPCTRPKLECASPEDFFVHEAGYHLAPFGDGGMRVATQEDARTGITLDSEGCLPVEGDDLARVVGSFRHGRNWVTHVWFDPDGGTPVWSNTDPWERWMDAVDRSTLVGTPFYSQGECDCEVAPVNERTGGCG